MGDRHRWQGFLGYRRWGLFGVCADKDLGASRDLSMCSYKSFWQLFDDWEASQLYRNVFRKHGANGWEVPFRHKLETELPTKDLMLLMGTLHRFPGQWLIVSLIYPPRRPTAGDQQMALF